MKRQLLAIVVILHAAGASLAAQVLSGDTVYLDPISIYYSGQPDTGVMKCGLHWINPPDTHDYGIRSVRLELNWTGAVVCDSFKSSITIGDTLLFYHNIYNDSSWSNLAAVLNSSLYAVLDFGGGDRHLGDYFFSVLDTGLVEFTSLHLTPVLTGPFFYWYGRFLGSAHYISIPGDFDNDGEPNTIADVMWMVEYIFGSQAPSPVPCADADGDCLANISDVVYLVHYIFFAGPDP
ncbi:MAG: hypothetical protein ABIJ61_06235, partial [bacterium]